MQIIPNHLLQKELSRINIEILESAYCELDKRWNANNRCSPFSRLYFIEKGMGAITINEKTINLIPDNIYIIPSDVVFSRSCEEYLHKLYFHINILRYNNYDVLSEINECIVLKNKKRIIDAAINHYRSNSITDVIALKTILYDVISEATSQESISFGSIELYSKDIKLAISHIENHLHCSLNSSIISKEIAVSESYLQKQFKKEVGVPIKHYINDQIMLVAEKMVRKNNIPLKDISDKLGFCDQFYFSRRFLERFGVPPIQYRKNHNSP